MNVKRDEVFEKIAGIISGRLAVPRDDIGWDSRLKEDLEADSLDLVELALMVEEEYGVPVLDEELGTFDTVGDVVEMILSKCGAA
jgi:acyl carrier protein